MVRDVGRRRGFLALVIVLLGLPAAVGAVEQPRSERLVDAVVLRDQDTTVVSVSDARRPEDVLASLRQARVRDIDLLVVATSSFAMADLSGWIDARHGVRAVWAPEATMGRGEVVPSPAARVRMGGVELRPVIEAERPALLL